MVKLKKFFQSFINMRIAQIMNKINNKSFLFLYNFLSVT